MLPLKLMPRSYGAGHYGRGRAPRASAPPWGSPRRTGGGLDDLVGWGPTRARDHARGLPQRDVPDAVRHSGRADGLVEPGRARRAPRGGLRVSRSLRRSCRDFEIRVDTACAEVIEACADPTRPGLDRGDPGGVPRLHELGWVHSVEAWRDGRLVGGLYGVAIGGLFAGESMFHRERDASKVALVGLASLLATGAPGDRLRRHAVADRPPGEASEWSTIPRTGTPPDWLVCSPCRRRRPSAARPRCDGPGMGQGARGQ